MTNSRQRLNELPDTPGMDLAIASAMENAQEMGLDEETDEEAFYAEVLGQVTA